MDNQLKDLEKATKAISELGQAVAEILIPLFQELGETMQQLYNAFWQAYLETGAVYGETDEGMLRWFREIGQVRQLQFEAERILQHHQTLAEFRKALKDKNGQPAN